MLIAGAGEGDGNEEGDGLAEGDAVGPALPAQALRRREMAASGSIQNGARRRTIDRLLSGRMLRPLGREIEGAKGRISRPLRSVPRQPQTAGTPTR